MCQEHQLKDATQAREFILAGNAYLTLRSGVSGTRYTFRVSQKKGAEVWFVSTLYGVNNTDDYRYIGVIDPDGFRVTPKSRALADSPQVKAFAWMWRNLTVAGGISDKVEIWHEGRCGKCGRTLTVPESIEAGLGPECAKQSSRPSKIAY